jgi:beta-1,4-N-acetylglucosaminyltransferase
VLRIPRAREVGQGALGAAWGTARGTLASFAVVLAEQPRLLLVNGPGTCLPVCAAAVLLRAVGALPADTVVVFVESVCRVTSLSLSGRLARWGLADVVAVQWPQLAAAFPGTLFVGLQV